MTRAEWQNLAAERAADAQALLAAGRWAFAYYAAGYAVECALKSCLLVYLGGAPEIVFREKRFREKCWTHNLEDLMGLAGLTAALAADIAANAQFENNWNAVTHWSEQSREMVAAVFDQPDGVLTWLMARW